MELKIWTRAVMTVYRKLGRAIDVLESAKNGLLYSGFGRIYPTGMGISDIYDKLISYNYRKLGLINLKVLAEEGLRRLPIAVREVLIARFVTGDLDSYASKYGICKRTAFKRVDSAILRLSEKFIELGYDEKKMELEYKKEPLLTQVVKRLKAYDYSKSS